MQGESNSKTGKRSFTGLDTAEPRLILYKDNARRVERGLVLTFPSAVYLIYKDTGKERHNQLSDISPPV